MKRVLVNSTGDIVYEGKDAKDKLESFKDAAYEVHFDLKFRGIDDWSRPVFKDVDSTLHFGCTYKLFDWKASEEEVIKYFKENPHLEYFGHTFNCEPNGGSEPNFKFNFINRDQ